MKQIQGRINICPCLFLPILIQESLVRDRPSTSGNVIGTLNKDEKVYVEDYDENWFYIKKGNLIGYVSGDYLKCAFVDYMKILYDTYMNYTEYNECFFYDINNDGTT